MALLAIRSQLPPVNIRMTVLASLSHVREYGFHVTLNAGHGLVHATQRVSRLIVVEFRNGADGSPSICRVAVLTRHVQITVRTVRAGGGLRASRESGEPYKHHDNGIEHTPTPPHDSPLALVTATKRNRNGKKIYEVMQFSIHSD